VEREKKCTNCLTWRPPARPDSFTTAPTTRRKYFGYNLEKNISTTLLLRSSTAACHARGLVVVHSRKLSFCFVLQLNHFSVISCCKTISAYLLHC
jgi:hypothetical protein